MSHAAVLNVLKLYCDNAQRRAVTCQDLSCTPCAQDYMCQLLACLVHSLPACDISQLRVHQACLLLHYDKARAWCHRHSTIPQQHGCPARPGQNLAATCTGLTANKEVTSHHNYHQLPSPASLKYYLCLAGPARISKAHLFRIPTQAQRDVWGSLSCLTLAARSPSYML